MSSSGWPPGTDCVVLPETDSTNAEAQRRFPGLTRPTWILALRQTAGRGRRGRPWASPEGNLAATLAMPLDEPAPRAALRSYVAALALLEALETLGATGLALKWPNDVLLGGRKLSGILLESRGTAGRVDRLAIGFGVNLAAAPAALPEGALPPATLAEAGLAVAPETLLDCLAPAYAALEARFAVHGFEPIRAAWLARAARLGAPVEARTTGRTTRGRFETIDAAGNLILATATGREAVAAADVYF